MADENRSPGFRAAYVPDAHAHGRLRISARACAFAGSLVHLLCATFLAANRLAAVVHLSFVLFSNKIHYHVFPIVIVTDCLLLYRAKSPGGTGNSNPANSFGLKCVVVGKLVLVRICSPTININYQQQYLLPDETIFELPISSVVTFICQLIY